MIIVDAKGLVCPKPVIMAKKALEEHDEVLIEVDNPMSYENLQKMAQVMGLTCEASSEGNIYKLTLKRSGEAVAAREQKGAYIVVVSSQYAGSGSDELGGALMKSFIYALTEAPKKPSSMIFYNGGVWLTTEGSLCLEDLKQLEAQGVEILSCGTCLNYYGLSEKLMIGSVTNMYEIIEKQQDADKIIRP